MCRVLNRLLPALSAADITANTTLARTISGLRIVIDMYEPMSDMWAYAQHHLPWLEYVWEEKFINEGEVDELNVYRKCRAVEQYIGIG